MKKLAVLLTALLCVHLALSFVHPASATPAATADKGVRIGVVFDVGGRGDKSFNDGAYTGAEKAIKDLGVHVRYVEPADGTDREAGLRLLASEGMDLVIGVGFIFTDDLTQIAKEYPNVRFAGIDFSVSTDSSGKPIQPPSNLAALKFREEQGSFLVGALAALTSKTKTVGFVGGMNFPLIQKFQAGYEAGVHQVCPACRVIVQYAGVTPDAFRDPGKGKELALSQYGQGADVIYHASGATGLGVFEAARQTGKLAIGVDADQYSEAPGHVLTSMVKGVDVAVYDEIQAVTQHSFKGGIYDFGLAEHGVGYIYDAQNKALIPDSIQTRISALSADVVSGKIKVPSVPANVSK